MNFEERYVVSAVFLCFGIAGFILEDFALLLWGVLASAIIGEILRTISKK